MPSINTETISRLVEIYSDDREMLDIIFGTLSDFEEYHHRIFEMETKLKVYTINSINAEEYKDMRETLDRSRTNKHNTVIGNVKMLNVLAEREKLSPVYDGVVSEERPYRRELADAVLEYVENIIKKRL